MGPRFRFMLVVVILATVIWAYFLVGEYLVGLRGLNLSRYIHGAFVVGSSVLGGYLLVWASIRFMNFRENRKTGFEAIKIDESGTKFNMQLSLSKFLPEIIAPTSPDQMSPLESELIGFLNSLGDWPYDLRNPTQTLRERSLQLWAVMNNLPNTGPLHRAAALAADLGKVYAFQEHRKSSPLWQFWKKDQVFYTLRCNEHGGMTSFILSQIPAFRNLGDNDSHRNQLERRALLTAIRYSKDSLKMPHNCDPLAREICEKLNLAYAQLQNVFTHEKNSQLPTEEHCKCLSDELTDIAPGVLTDMNFSAEHIHDLQHGFYLGQGQLVINADLFSQSAIRSLSSNLRTVFRLWEDKEATTTLIPHIVSTFRDAGCLIETWEGEQGYEGFFSFTVGKTSFSKALILDLHNQNFTRIRKNLDLISPLKEPVDIQHSTEQRLATLSHKVAAIDEELSKAFPQ